MVYGMSSESMLRISQVSVQIMYLHLTRSLKDYVTLWRYTHNKSMSAHTHTYTHTCAPLNARVQSLIYGIEHTKAWFLRSKLMAGLGVERLVK